MSGKWQRQMRSVRGGSMAGPPGEGEPGRLGAKEQSERLIVGYCQP